MARGYKTGGRQKGSLNKRTMARAELQSRHGVGAASPALSKMRECAEWMLGLVLARAKQCEARATKVRDVERREWQMTLARTFRMLAEAESEAAARRLSAAA
jgi:hypothetical protein